MIHYHNSFPNYLPSLNNFTEPQMKRFVKFRLTFKVFLLKVGLSPREPHLLCHQETPFMETLFQVPTTRILLNYFFRKTIHSLTTKLWSVNTISPLLIFWRYFIDITTKSANWKLNHLIEKSQSDINYTRSLQTDLHDRLHINSSGNDLKSHMWSYHPESWLMSWLWKTQINW